MIEGLRVRVTCDECGQGGGTFVISEDGRFVHLTCQESRNE